jgi:rubredoxin
LPRADGTFKVSARWEEPDALEVSIVACKCGYIDYGPKNPRLGGDNYWEKGDEWVCPECGAKARFVYYGWGLEEVNDDGDEVTKLDMSVEERDKMTRVIAKALEERLKKVAEEIRWSVADLLFIANGDSVDSGKQYGIRIQYMFKVEDLARLLKMIRAGKVDEEVIRFVSPDDRVRVGVERRG